MKNNLIGIDLGGTKIEIVILDENKEIQFRERIPTESASGSSHIINQIVALYKKAVLFFVVSLLISSILSNHPVVPLTTGTP